ncbi:hypothetical protein MYX76_07770 [Desulfobacterota bacterium AH_259_B03_O07]|nr:hypothetical protein [Desulfobacterota bacterium AH_259_B03_O07]
MIGGSGVMGRRIIRTTLILLFLLSVGCTASYTVINKKPDSKRTKYDVIEIPNFDKTELEWVPYDSYAVIPDMIAEKLRDTNQFRMIKRTESNSFSEEGVLVIKGTVTGYDRGCKYCEWYSLGINDKGKGALYLGIRLIDKNTGDTITDASVYGRAKDPGYGRSKYIRVTDEIVDLIEKVNK